VARKLVVIMHAMWSGGTYSIGHAATSTADIAALAAVKDHKLLDAHP
jgi:transposase